MGERGPAPKRSSERRRRNKENAPDTVAATGPVEIPPADEEWHPIAREWYDSLAASGQVRYLEPSDWQAARVVATELSSYLKSSKRSAQMFAALWAAMGDLLTTEAARRRLRLEVERDTGDAQDD